MAYYSTLFAFLLPLLTISSALSQNGVVLPLRKDPKTSQFLTTFQMGSRRSAINAVLNLGGPHLWFSCDAYASATYAPVPCDSAKCDLAEGIGCLGCNRPARPGCSNNTCGAASDSPFVPYLSSSGFFEDTLSSQDHVSLPEIIFSCVSDDFLAGLAAGAAGMMGVGRSSISFHKQVAGKINAPDRFSICPPSSGLGKFIIGGGAPAKSDISGLLKSTPLILNGPTSSRPKSVPDLSEQYFIDVRSVNVAGEPLSVKSSYFNIDRDRVGGTKINSVLNYTTMHTSIYKPMVRAFDKAAADMKMRSVAAVAPFRACYSKESVKRTAAGPEAPAIDLVLPGKDVYWRISGANAVVEVDRKTMCLAFVDGGSRPETAIVIGAHQLEENFMEFDLVSSQLRFTSSLLLHNTSCSRL